MKTERNHIDIWILVAVMTLMVLSLGIVYSASATFAMQRWGESERLLTLHMVKVLLAFLAIFIAMHVDYKILERISKPTLIVAVLLLLITLVFGGEAKGATRWLHFGGLGFQPSDFAKYALIVHVCTLLARKGRNDGMKDYKTGFLPVLFWIGLVTVLVLAQPNFSNGTMIFLLGIVLLFVGRAKLTHLVLTFSPLVVMLGFYMVSAPYRMKRITGFFSDTGYQLMQGIIAFGNGGVFGVGMGESRQRDLFLPESYGDFVFSIVGEEYGLVGTLFFLALFLLIMLRGMRIAKNARDDFGRFLAVGITISVTLFALINAGVTLGLLPTTGLPMPFVSYGGTSMIFSALAIGVLLNISTHTDLYPRLTKPDHVRSLDPASATPG